MDEESVAPQPKQETLPVLDLRTNAALKETMRRLNFSEEVREDLFRRLEEKLPDGTETISEEKAKEVEGRMDELVAHGFVLFQKMTNLDTTKTPEETETESLPWAFFRHTAVVRNAIMTGTLGYLLAHDTLDINDLDVVIEADADKIDKLNEMLMQMHKEGMIKLDEEDIRDGKVVRESLSSRKDGIISQFFGRLTAVDIGIAEAGKEVEIELMAGYQVAVPNPERQRDPEAPLRVMKKIAALDDQWRIQDDLGITPNLALRGIESEDGYIDPSDPRTSEVVPTVYGEPLLAGYLHQAVYHQEEKKRKQAIVRAVATLLAMEKEKEMLDNDPERDEPEAGDLHRQMLRLIPTREEMKVKPTRNKLFRRKADNTLHAKT